MTRREDEVGEPNMEAIETLKWDGLRKQFRHGCAIDFGAFRAHAESAPSFHICTHIHLEDGELIQPSLRTSISPTTMCRKTETEALPIVELRVIETLLKGT